MVGVQQQFGCVAEIGIGREPMRISVPMRADDRQVPDSAIQPPGEDARCGIRWQQAVRIERQPVCHAV